MPPPAEPQSSGLVAEILRELGCTQFGPESILVDSGSTAVTLLAPRQYGRFIGVFSVRAGCMPYSLDDTDGLSIAEFCARHERESNPAPPTTALETHPQLPRSGATRTAFEPVPYPVCFVLGCGRSGTTLFRAMLNQHSALWAPGEMHLAQFDTLAERAHDIGPFLRHSLLAEVATRLGEDPDSFTARFASWESDSMPTTEVFRRLHEADPSTMIVDKTPSYSMWSEDLEWITTHFPEARFIHLIRNPFDVIRSLVRMQLYKAALPMFEAGINPHHVAETTWFRHNTNIESILRDIEPERSTIVRFEDLVTGPQASLSQVCELLEISIESAMATPYGDNDAPLTVGAGDPRVNLLTSIEPRPTAEPFFPLAEATTALAERLGYPRS